MEIVGNIAKVGVQIGEMVPVIGGFIKGASGILGIIADNVSVSTQSLSWNRI